MVLAPYIVADFGPQMYNSAQVASPFQMHVYLNTQLSGCSWIPSAYFVMLGTFVRVILRLSSARELNFQGKTRDEGLGPPKGLVPSN